MKKLLFPLIALIALGFTSKPEKLSDADRTMLLTQLTQTRNHLIKTLEGLTSAQLHFKASENSWSIIECVEHLALTEEMFLKTVHKSVAEGPKPELRDSLVFTDDQIMPMIVDRSNKVKTAQPFEPSGKFGSPDETVEALLNTRTELMEYVMNTDDDLRNCFNSDLPFGTVDGVQLIVFIAGHAERHILQMEEVMKDENYPKIQ